MASPEDLLATQNVDDIIAQYDDDLSTDLNIDDLLNDDLVSCTLSQSKSNTKPQLTSTLPKPIAPKTDINTGDNNKKNNVPDLPSTVSRYANMNEEEELNIESIIADTNMDDDDSLNLNDDDLLDDALLEFDPYDITSSTPKDISDNDESPNKANINKYSDIQLDDITSLIKREEIRMKQRMEIGNYTMIEPLTKRMQSTNINNKTEKESFFKLALRENITKTLEHHRSEYGPPTVVKSHTKFIAMGMKNGSVFIFDHFEQLKVELTCSDARQLRMGSVTSLDFNYNGTLLIVGYYGGQLVLWDIINNRELKKIKDAHVSPIIFAMFYRRGALRIASCDSNGIMFTWSFTKIFFSYNVDRNTLFNGKRAGVLYDIAQYKSNPNHRHILDASTLCAVANNESVFFVTLEPPKTLKQTILLPNTSISDLKRGALPMLSWRLSYNSSTSSSNPSSSTPHVHTFNPVLAVGSGTVIQFIEIFIRDEAQFNQTRDTSLIRMRGIGQIQLKKLVVAMRWLNQENLVILTANDEILICNGWPIAVTETLWPIPTISPVQSYDTSLISPLSGIRSVAMNAQSTISMDFFVRHQYFGKHIICFKHCFETIAGLDRTGQTNRLIITTNTNIVTAHCMTWYDRIEKLIKEGEWIKACCLIIEFFNRYEHGQIPQSQNIKRLFGKIDGYILQFCDFVVQSNKISDDELELFGGVAMDYCVCLKRTESLLFDKVYKILLNNGGREIFFKLLEPYILNDRITTLPPEFMQKFADFLVSRNNIYELQQIILHLSPQSFDIHQIVSICRDNQLFMSLCYLYNTACLDYGEPIKDMFHKIIKKENEQKDYDQITQRGYQLILYLKYIMNGTTFPWCNVLHTPLKAKQQIFNVLFDDTQQYQILRHLLVLDLKEVLFNVIKIGFDDQHLFRVHKSTPVSGTNSPNRIQIENRSESVPNTPQKKKQRRTSIQIKDMLSNAQSAVMNGAKWAWSLSAVSSKHNSPNHSRFASGIANIDTNINIDDVLDTNIHLKTKQEMFDILVQIIIFEMKSENENEIFFEFCTPLLASGECEVNIHLLKSVLNYLFSESLKLLDKIEKLHKNIKYQTQTQEKQLKQKDKDKTNDKIQSMKRELDRLIITSTNFENTILILLSRKMEQNNKDFDINELLRMAKLSQFHKVELYLHRESGNHWAVIDSYLADKDLEKQVFDYINNLFYDIKQESDVNKKFISAIQIILKRFTKLVRINSEQCCELIFNWFPQYFDKTVHALTNNRKTQYIFLGQIVKSMRSMKHKQSNIGCKDDVDDLNTLEGLLLSNEFTFEKKQHEQYIRLLCEFESESVLSYLSSNSDKFDIDLVARYCDKYEILDGSSYLRERSGDILGALQLILKSIGNGISRLWDIFKSDYALKKITTATVQSNSYYISNTKINKIMDELMMAIGLCQRHSDTTNNVLWNHLLDACLVSQQKINNEIKTPSFRQQYPMSEIRYLMKQTVNDIVSKTLSTMMTEKNIDLCDMFEKLVDKESSEKYEYYKDTIDVMLSTYKYETEMLKTANNLFKTGVHKEYENHVNTAGSSYKTVTALDIEENTNTKICKICDSSISHFNPKRLRLFYCGHLFHEQCLYSCTQNEKQCPICYSNMDNKMQLQHPTLQHSLSKSAVVQDHIHTQTMANYAKKLNQLKHKLQQRDRMMEDHRNYVPLSLAPKNKASLPKAQCVNMHIPVASWGMQFEANKRKACIIEID